MTKFNVAFVAKMKLDTVVNVISKGSRRDRKKLRLRLIGQRKIIALGREGKTWQRNKTRGSEGP